MTNNVKNILLELQNAKSSNDSSNILKIFYNETSHMVYSFCKKKGLTNEDAEEITQIVYIKIFQKRSQYNPEHSPLAWLYVITRSETKDYLKSKKTYNSYVSDFSDFMSQNEDSNPSTHQVDLKEKLEQTMLLSLNENEIKVLKLRYTDEKDFEEIAQELNTSALNIRKMISRSIKKLKERSS